jgi:hypothetical protein
VNDSRIKLMDRHLKRVERWFLRCVVACKCGSWSDALSEVECLEAEARGLREKLWSAVEEEALGVGRRGIGYSAFMVFKAVSLAMVIVLAAVFPLSLDPESNVSRSFDQIESIAMLTSAESDIINALRESLSGSNSGRVVLTVEITENVPVPVEERGAAMASEIVQTAPKRSNVVNVTKISPGDEEKKEEVPVFPQARRPSVEEVISLIQVGQRALRVSEPGVKLVPQ